MKTKALMVMGTSSGAGKSLLVTALCRYYARLGYKVAPFKAQNMSNNSRVVADGEMGSAQYLQALAAKIPPDVRMNPLLLKPERDDKSQVILMGKVNEELGKTAWRDRRELVLPTITKAYAELAGENDIMIIEGAGSPAEINLYDSDVVNCKMAEIAKAKCLLVCDVDRGGAFAHLYGTWSLMPQKHRAQICGFILNKFRGDASLLSPAPEKLFELTGIKTLGVLPMWLQHGLPEEDGMYHNHKVNINSEQKNIITIAIIKYPYLSNHDEFQSLSNLSQVKLIWAQTPAQCVNADWIVLAGSKNTFADLAWLYQNGFDKVIKAHNLAGKVLLGICGGLQMLGDRLIYEDEKNIAVNANNSVNGLSLLPITTRFAREKTVKAGSVKLSQLKNYWTILNDLEVSGYEIHNGVSKNKNTAQSQTWQNEQGNILGCYLHGIFENSKLLERLFGEETPTLDSVFDDLADFTEKHIEHVHLQSLIAGDNKSNDLATLKKL